MKNQRHIFIILFLLALAAACGRRPVQESGEEIAALDTAVPIVTDTVIARDTVREEPDFHEPEFAGGVIPSIEAASPEYAERLKREGGRGFIVVDKARMKVILYDRYGEPMKVYGMACAKNYGTKHGKGDSRTPEGFFSVQGVYDSTDWLFTDDNGKTSKKKGQFGPRFIRLSIPTTSQIGIHGTCAPWSIGHRASHGCIRITNENIMELVDLVHPGMPVIVIPGKRDRQVNREEGVDVVYFPTAPEYAIKDYELKQIARKEREREDTVVMENTVEPSDSALVRPDLLKEATVPEHVEITDSVF